MTTPTQTKRPWITADPAAFLAEPLEAVRPAEQEEQQEESTPKRQRRMRVPRMKRVGTPREKRMSLPRLKKSTKTTPTEKVRAPRLRLRRTPKLKGENGQGTQRAGSSRKNRRLIALVAVAGLLVAGKFALGSLGGGSSDAATPIQPAQPDPTVAAWTFQPTSATAACTGDVATGFRKTLRRFIPGPAPERLRDYALKTAPVAGYKVAAVGPVSVSAKYLVGSKAPFVADGVVDGFGQSFAGAGKAGFTYYAFEFPTAQAATQAAADAYVKLVCSGKAQPMSLGQAGVVAAVPVGKKANTVAIWTRGRRLLEVDYKMVGSRATDLANAAAAVHAAWAWSMRTAG